MTCAWDQLLSVLPPWIREAVDKHGCEHLEEIRMRYNSEPELNNKDRQIYLNRKVMKEDLEFCIHAASKYSPWTATGSAYGYITSAGGHRIGICGNAILRNGNMEGIRNVSSLCIRIAKDYPQIAKTICSEDLSTLIIGRPGCGKTTLLRDLIRQISDVKRQTVAVVDEREEIFPQINGIFCFPPGKRTDVLTGARKREGVEAVLRTMRPDVIAVDEITAQQDCEALYYAGWCGVKLLATAHAGSVQEFKNRELYKPLYNSGLFERLIVMQRDKTWKEERLIV